jgi:long-chain fatty acid transport protein
VFSASSLSAVFVADLYGLFFILIVLYKNTKVLLIIVKVNIFSRGVCMRRIFMCCLWVLVFYGMNTETVLGQGYNNFFQGGRAVGLAGAFTAGAKDASAVFYNPAGIINVPGTQVQAGWSIVKYNTVATIGFPAYALSDNITKNVWLFPPAMYIVSRITSHITGGFGLYSPMGYNIQYKSDWPARGLGTKIQLSSRSYNPVIAYRINQEMSIGVGFQYVNGKYLYNLSPLIDINDPLTEVNDKYDMDGSGNGFTAGIQYSPIERLGIGVSYRGSVALNLDGAITRTGYAADQSSIKSKINIPASLAAGVQFFSQPEISFEADVIWTQWSAIKSQVFTAENPSLSLKQDRRFKNTIQFRIGMEYTIEYNAAFRTGYFYAPEQTISDYIDPSFPETRREGATAGFGWSYERFTIDAAYIHFFKSNENTSEINIFSGTFENTGDGAILNISYRIR